MAKRVEKHANAGEDIVFLEDRCGSVLPPFPQRLLTGRIIVYPPCTIAVEDKKKKVEATIDYVLEKLY